MGWVTRWNVKSDSDRKWYLQKCGSGNLKQRPSKKLSHRRPLTVFHLEIKADSGEKGERREGFGKQECSFAKAVGGQTESTSEGAQCDSALTWATEQSRVDVLWQKQTQKPGPCKDCLNMILSDPLSSPITTAVLIVQCYQPLGLILVVLH